MSSSIKVEKLTLEDFEECFYLRDKLVFGPDTGTDFNSFTLFPAHFNFTQECADMNWITRSEGRIVSCVANIPGIMNIAGEHIKIGRISGVATLSQERGKGHMQAIINEILAYYKDEGIVASHLMGQRKRYQHFGFEKTGVLYEFKLIEKNAKEIPHRDCEISFIKMENDDTQAIAFSKQLYDQEPIHFERSIDKFRTVLTHLYNTPFIAKDTAGELAGYIVFDEKKRSINEICAKTTKHFEAMIVAALRDFGGVSMVLPPWQADYISCIVPICEHMSVSSCGEWLINEWEPLIRALLKAKAAYTDLPDGKFSIGIDGYGTLSLEVKDNKTSCTRSDASPDIAVDAFTASRLMCGHESPIYTTKIPKSLLPIVSTWFPLPLYIAYSEVT